MMLMRRALSARLAVQAAAMKVLANITVQLISRWYNGPEQFAFDYLQVLEFALYGSLNSQLSNVIQFVLEDWFPTAKGSEDFRLPVRDHEALLQLGEKKDDELAAAASAPAGGIWIARPRSLLERLRRRLGLREDVIWRNLLAKMLLDQTIGLAISAIVFLTFTNIARVPHPSLVLPVIRSRILSLVLAGWHIWPLVALVNFLWVPVRSRVLVTVFFGFGWSVFLSVFAMRT